MKTLDAERGQAGLSFIRLSCRMYCICNAIENLLENGQSLSAFVEQSVRESVERRQRQQAFIERGLLAAKEARESGVYHSPDEVIAELKGILQEARDAAACLSPSE